MTIALALGAGILIGFGLAAAALQGLAVLRERAPCGWCGKRRPLWGCDCDPVAEMQKAQALGRLVIDLAPVINSDLSAADAKAIRERLADYYASDIARVEAGREPLV